MPIVYLMIYPVREYTKAGSSDSFIDHPPEKSASTKHLSPLSFLGYMISQFYFVPFKYLMILFTPLSCNAFGLAENLAAECVAYVMSGLEEPEIEFSRPIIDRCSQLEVSLAPYKSLLRGGFTAGMST